MDTSLTRQIEAARKHIKKLKRCNPYIFLQYDRLQRAKRNFEAAKKELEEARAAWRDL